MRQGQLGVVHLQPGASTSVISFLSDAIASAFSGNAYRVSVTGTAASTTNVEVSDSLIAVDTTEVEGIETNQLVLEQVLHNLQIVYKMHNLLMYH